MASEHLEDRIVPTEDDTVLQVLRESQNRIKSMALIHEKLYHSHDFTQIDFADYIRSLVGHLMHTYRTAGGVSLKVDVGQVSFGLDRAIPLGLIINELVSNALKYAFPRDKRGEITVSLREEAGREDTLIVHDNGVGFPEDIDFEHSPSPGFAARLYAGETGRWRDTARPQWGHDVHSQSAEVG